MRAQMRLIGVLAGGVDHDEEIPAAIDDHQIIENAAIRIGELGVALPAARQAPNVLRHQGLQRGCRVLDTARLRGQRDLAHMRDVEQPRGAAGMQVFPEHARWILHGHVVARERHHPGAEAHMQPVQGRLFHGEKVVAPKHR